MVLDVSENNMFGKKDKAGITAWADALKANLSLTQLNLANNNINRNDAKIIAPAISANRALTTITFGDNEAVTMNTSMTEADFSGKYLEASGAIIVAAFLPKCQ